MPRRRSTPDYVPAVNFYRSLAVSFESGTKMLELGVLRADATLNGRPIFLADLATFKKAKEAVLDYRRRQNRAVQQVKEVYV